MLVEEDADILNVDIRGHAHQHQLGLPMGLGWHSVPLANGGTEGDGHGAGTTHTAITVPHDIKRRIDVGDMCKAVVVLDAVDFDQRAPFKRGPNILLLDICRDPSDIQLDSIMFSTVLLMCGSGLLLSISPGFGSLHGRLYAVPFSRLLTQLDVQPAIVSISQKMQLFNGSECRSETVHMDERISRGCFYVHPNDVIPKGAEVVIDIILGSGRVKATNVHLDFFLDHGWCRMSPGGREMGLLKRGNRVMHGWPNVDHRHRGSSVDRVVRYARGGGESFCLAIVCHWQTIAVGCRLGQANLQISTAAPTVIEVTDGRKSGVQVVSEVHEGILLLVPMDLTHLTRVSPKESANIFLAN